MVSGFKVVACALLACVCWVVGVCAGERPGVYYGFYGGAGSFDPGAVASSYSTSTEYLQGSQTGTAEQRYIDDAITQGIAIERVATLPGEACPAPSAATSCYRIHAPDEIITMVETQDGEAQALRLQGGITTTTTEHVSYSADTGTTGGAVIGYRLGAFRLEADVGFSRFTITKTTVTASSYDANRPVVPDNVQDGVRQDLQGQIDDALENRLRAKGDPAARTAFESSRELVPTLLANLFFDIRLDAAARPYVGAGAGVGWVDGEARFAWDLQTGLGFELSGVSTLTIGYRFQRIENSRFGDLTSHAGLIGLRIDW